MSDSGQQVVLKIVPASESVDKTELLHLLVLHK